MPDGLVRDGKFSEVHTDHLGLHLNTAEHLSVVDTDDGADHLRDDDHVTEVGLDATGLLAGRSLLLGLTEALDEGHGLALEATGHAAAGTAADEIHELIVGEVKELVELDATVGELTELTLLAKLGNLLSVHDCYERLLRNEKSSLQVCEERDRREG